MSFSKEWITKLESCPHYIVSYEAPSSGGNMKTFKPGYGEYETFGTIGDEMDEINSKIKTKEGEVKAIQGPGRFITIEELRQRAKRYKLDKYLDKDK